MQTYLTITTAITMVQAIGFDTIVDFIVAAIRTH